MGCGAVDGPAGGGDSGVIATAGDRIGLRDATVLTWNAEVCTSNIEVLDVARAFGLGLSVTNAGPLVPEGPLC